MHRKIFTDIRGETCALTRFEVVIVAGAVYFNLTTKFSGKYFSSCSITEISPSLKLKLGLHCSQPWPNSLFLFWLNRKPPIKPRLDSV